MVHGLEVLRDVVARRGREGAGEWLDEALRGMEPALLGRVRVAMARCGRKVGDALVGPDDLATLGLGDTSVWRVVDVARAALVLRAFELAEAPLVVAAFGGWLRRAEQGEQVSLLRMLPLLPEPRLLVDVAIDACRTNSEVVFRAIACGNPFVTSHFPDANFNQLVLKAVFLGVPVAEIVNLQSRVQPELLRMADDYAAERAAAGRSVPSDIALLRTLWESR